MHYHLYFNENEDIYTYLHIFKEQSDSAKY